MTAARVAAPQARIQRLGKTRAKARKATNALASDDGMPGWYSASRVTPEQRAAVRLLLARRGVPELVEVLGVQEMPT